MSNKHKLFAEQVLLAALCTALLAAVPSAVAEQAQALRPTSGMFLVAAPKMRDPRFQQTVILLVEHSADGSLGFIINKVTGVTVSEAFPELGVVSTDHILYFGGPVQPERVAFVHRGDPGSDDVNVFDDVYWGAGFERVKDLLQEKGADALRIFFGYAGWGPGQLEFELSLDDWLLSSASGDRLFSEDVRGLWRKLNGRNPGVVTQSGSAASNLAGVSGHPGLPL